MTGRSARCGWVWVLAVVIVAVFAANLPASAQSAKAPTETVNALEQRFFAAIRDGNSDDVLSLVPKGGVNVGSEAQHMGRDEIEQQFLQHRGLYCKLFDSACVDATLRLDGSRSCSYRELLTRSENVHTAASEMTRGGVQQAVLVARIDNPPCPDMKLVDFIFNLHADGWKLFSIP